MGYDKHTWYNGEVVTAPNLNHIEDGIFNSQEKIDATHKVSADFIDDATTAKKLVTATEKANWDSKSAVSVSDTGTATNEVSYITVNGTPYKLKGKTYTAGANVAISDTNVISATDTTYTAGNNVQINGTTISATNTTYSEATTSAAGLMSAIDKTKLEGITAGAKKVEVSATGTSTDEVHYIKIDDVEKKIAGEPETYIKNAAISGKTLTLTKKDNSTVSFTETGKAWRTVELSAADVMQLAAGNEITGTLSPEYDPADFKNDYFVCKVQQNGVDYGHMLYPTEAMTSVRVSLDSFINIATYLGKSLIEGMDNYGFFHNYYKTMMLFAGTTDTTEYILRGDSIVDGANVVYVQDVSQQWWEYNTNDEGGKGVQQSREQSDIEEYGKAFVFHFKGATSEMNFLYCLQTSEAAYWYEDSEVAKVRWAQIEAGKFYQVTFDGLGEGTHNTQRWLVTPTTIEGRTGVFATQITNEQKESWQNTGINFGSGIYAAQMYEDTTLKSVNKIIGWYQEWLSRVISFNETFGEARSEYLEYIGRPIGYMLDTVTYNKSGVLKIEKDGEHVWQCDVDGVIIQLIIPDNNDEQGIAHRDTYIMRFDMSNISSRATLSRHTFTIRPWQEATFTEGDTVARICFCAVNAQAGDSSIDYLLHSDETGQGTDWILPVSGIVGIATGTGQAVNKWYTALRVMAGWKQVEGSDDIRCLYVNYLDETAQGTTEDPFVKKVELLTDYDTDLYEVADFRTDLLTVNTPYNRGKY